MGKKNEIKIKNIFMIFIILWVMDFVLTFIALNFSNNFVEINPIARFFYGMGFSGFLLFFVIVFFYFLILSYSLHKISYNKYNRKPELTMKVGLFVYLIISITIILNGAYWLIT